MAKFSWAFAALFLGVQASTSTSRHARLDTNAIVQRAANDTPVAGGILADTYIVEFANDNETPESFYASLAASGVQVQPRHNLSFRFFKGVSFRVKGLSSSFNSSGGDFLSQMKAQSQVANIWPTLITTSSREGGAAVPAQQKHVKRQASTSQDTFSPHVMTQVDRLHAENVTGRGYRIAIVDSGIDYTHPALGGCFGPGCLVEIGYDFVGDNYIVGKNEPQPDDDPMDNCVGHGTHVAGSIAAQLKGNKYAFTGSAPGAKLAAYRMWGCSATSTTEIEVMAFGRAVEDGADIISFSDGRDSSWAHDVRAVVVSRIVDSGIPVVVSEGNDGFHGLFYASTPATGSSVTGAGAVSNTKFPAFLEQGSYTTSANATTNGTHEFGFLMGVPAFAADTTLPLWSAGDACKPLPDDTPDLSQRIVLLESKDPQATQCYSQDQGANIAAKGGRFMLYYERSNLTMRNEPYVYADGIKGVARVVPHVAEQWHSLLSQGATVSVTIPANGSQTRLEELENNERGGYVAGRLSSWGPSWELSMTPQVVSPGENILSTFPTALGSYRVMTGTSMATPLVSGIYAMLGEVYGKLEPKRLRRLLTHTSKPLAWYDGKTAHPDILAPVPQQGAGLVQAWNAAHTTLEIDVDNLMLNDTDHFVGSHTFSIANTGSADEVLELKHRKAVTMYTMDPTDSVLHTGSFPNAIVESWATVSFSSDRINVPAGQSVKVTVDIAPPTGLNATLLPVYSGFIALGDKLVLPYLGVVGSMRNVTVLTPENTYLAQGYAPAPANASYTIPRPSPGSLPMANGDTMATPNVYMNPVVGSPLVRVEVLQGDKVLGPLVGFPQTYVPRSEVRAFFNGLLADGRVLDEGSYRMRVKALHIFGDEEREEDWDIIDSAGFVFKYKT